MLSWLHKLRTKIYRPPSTTVPKMDSEARMGDVDSPTSVWIPSSAIGQRHHLDRHRSFRRQLSRKLSSRAKQLSICNATVCAIAVCFIAAILALIVSCFTFYMYVHNHGLGFEMNIVTPHPESRNGASPPPSFDGLETTMPQPSYFEGAAKSAYAHIVGTDNGPRGNDMQLECLAEWKVNVTHNVKFLSSYGIEIVESGYYYLYTQIYFSDSESGDTVVPSSQQALPKRSSTNRNHVPLMESVVPFNESATKYHGGVFHLEKGDRITVSVSNNNLRIMNTGSDKTFFGVSMLRSTMDLGSSMPDHRAAVAITVS